MIRQQVLQVRHSALKIVDVRSRYFSFGDGIVTHALDPGLFARGTCWQALVAAILAQPAAIASGDVAEGGRGGGSSVVVVVVVVHGRDRIGRGTAGGAFGRRLVQQMRFLRVLPWALATRHGRVSRVRLHGQR